MNIDAILNYERPKETYYDVIGCAQSSTVEQINREYKIRALQFHPDKNPGDPASSERFRLLQVAKDTLTDISSRRSYDNWLNSRVNIPFEQWQARKGHSMHWAPPRSGRLGIGATAGSSEGQGSDSSAGGCAPPVAGQQETAKVDLLEKFRNYDI